MRERPNINGPLLWSAAFIGAVVILALFMVPALLKAAFMPGGDDAELTARFTTLIGEHEEAQRTYQDRFNGRSIFFKPPQPRREVVSRPPAPPAPRSTDRPRTTTPPPPPPDPVRPPYSGPAVRAFIGDEVWFHGDLRVSLGEPPKNGIEVISFDLPWSVKVAYGGWEYDVPIFERSMDAVLQRESPAQPGSGKSPSSPSSVPGLIEAPPGAVVPPPPASTAVPIAAAGDGAAKVDGKPQSGADPEAEPKHDAAPAEKSAARDEKKPNEKTASDDGEKEGEAEVDTDESAADPEKTAAAPEE